MLLSDALLGRSRARFARSIPVVLTTLGLGAACSSDTSGAGSSDAGPSSHDASASGGRAGHDASTSGGDGGFGQAEAGSDASRSREGGVPREAAVLDGGASVDGRVSDAAHDAAVPDGAPGSRDAGASNDGGPRQRCSVAVQGTAGVVLRGEVLAPAGPLSGEVFVDETGAIACVSSSCAAVQGYSAATVLACARAVIAPGFVNAHVHADFSSAPPVVHGTTRWQHRNGWRKGTGGEPILAVPSRSTDVAVTAASELRHVLGGATSLSGSGGIDGLARNLAGLSPRLEGLSGPPVFFDTFPLGDLDGTELTSGCAYPSIRPASDAFANGGWYSPHIAEGINLAAQNEFSCLSGTLVTNHTAILHAVGIDARDVAAIRAAGAAVVWSPRSEIDLYGDSTPLMELARAGVLVALGTDWLATGSMNMLRELACARSLGQKYYPNAFGEKELVDMVTANAAIALGWGAQLGAMSEGFAGDIAVFDASSAAGYAAVLDAGVEDVLLVLRGGKPLYGEASLVDALAAGCDSFPVCGRDKKVCLDTPGVTLPDVEAAAAATYPLFFCKGETPDLEPSCVPYRDTYPDGISATDRDGDGVADALDDCPDVFNPPRPMHGMMQADVDGDGAGDACDGEPLVATP